MALLVSIESALIIQRHGQKSPLISRVMLLQSPLHYSDHYHLGLSIHSSRGRPLRLHQNSQTGSNYVTHLSADLNYHFNLNGISYNRKVLDNDANISVYLANKGVSINCKINFRLLFYYYPISKKNNCEISTNVDIVSNDK